MKNKLLLIDKNCHAPLSKIIACEYNKLLSLLSNIKLNLRTIKEIDGTGGKVSISNLIAYQIGWGKLLINWYKTGLEEKIPQMPGDGFSKWDYVGLAKRFYEKYQYDNYLEQEQEFYNVVNTIIGIVEHEYEINNLDKKGVWAWCTLSSGKQWPLSKWIKINTASPYKKASLLIKKFIKQ